MFLKFLWSKSKFCLFWFFTVLTYMTSHDVTLKSCLFWLIWIRGPRPIQMYQIQHYWTLIIENLLGVATTPLIKYFTKNNLVNRYGLRQWNIFEGSVLEYLNSKIAILRKCKQKLKKLKEPHYRNSMELRFCCSEHKTDPLQSPCKLYEHIVVSPGVKILLPNTISAVQQGKLPGSDLTFVYCVNAVRVGVKILCTEIASVTSFILIPKSNFCQKWS